MDRTLEFQYDSNIEGNLLKLQFHRMEESALVISASISGTHYRLYYLAPKWQLCVEGESKGVILYDIFPVIQITIQVTDSKFVLSGNTLEFDSSKTTCSNVAHLTIGQFSTNVG